MTKRKNSNFDRMIQVRRARYRVDNRSFMGYVLVWRVLLSNGIIGQTSGFFRANFQQETVNFGI